MHTAGELAIVLNPASGGGRHGDAEIERLRTLAAGRGAVFITEQRDLTDAIAEGVRERGVGTVAIVGGDGTVSSVVSALHRAYGEAPLPRVALLRGGSMNTLANALDIAQGTPDKLLTRLLARPGGPVLERATLRVDGRIGFLFSAGVMVGFLDALYNSGSRGKLAALRLLARGGVASVTGGELMARLETPITAALHVDGTHHPLRRYVALGAGTVAQVGLGFRPYPLAEQQLDAFQVFAYHGTVQMLARELPRIHRGQPVSESLGFAPLTRSLVIESEGDRIRYALDGDLLETDSPMKIALGPAVRIVVL